MSELVSDCEGVKLDELVVRQVGVLMVPCVYVCVCVCICVRVSE